jgi:hypothetical protein
VDIVPLEKADLIKPDHRRCGIIPQGVHHLQTSVHEEPVANSTYRKKYLVLYDPVPGGTGCLKQLMRSEKPLLQVLEAALETLNTCPCNQNSGLIDYGDMDVLHKDHDAVVLTFLDFYRQGNSGDDLKYLVFDSKLTTYQNLSKLDQQDIKFLTLKADEIIRKYSRRWLIEKTISEQIEFFHLNRVSSSMVIKVDFDLTMTILAHNLYRLLADDLERYTHFSDNSIYEKFIMNSGEIEVDYQNIKVKLKKKKNLPQILSTMNRFASLQYPWRVEKS